AARARHRVGARRRPVGILRAARARERHPRGHLRDPPQHPRRARAWPAEGLNAMADLLYEVKDRIATITLNRPDKLNAFTSGMIEAWAKSLAEAQHDDGVNVVVVTGAGRAFCAGGDVGRMGSGEPTPLDHKNQLWQGIHNVPKIL